MFYFEFVIKSIFEMYENVMKPKRTPDRLCNSIQQM